MHSDEKYRGTLRSKCPPTDSRRRGSNHIDVNIQIDVYPIHTRSFSRAREYAVRIIASEHLSYKIAVDTCQGNIKL